MGLDGKDGLRNGKDFNLILGIRSGGRSPVGYARLRNLVKEIGEEALSMDVSPKLMRDSRATYLARKNIGRYQMCKLMGWSMSSRMPDRYIDRAGVAEEEALEAIRRDDLAKPEEDKKELQRRVYELEHKAGNLEKQAVGRSHADAIMGKLLTDRQIQEMLVRRIKELGLDSEILGA